MGIALLAHVLQSNTYKEKEEMTRRTIWADQRWFSACSATLNCIFLVNLCTRMNDKRKQISSGDTLGKIWPGFNVCISTDLIASKFDNNIS